VIFLGCSGEGVLDLSLSGSTVLLIEDDLNVRRLLPLHTVSRRGPVLRSWSRELFSLN